MKKWKLKAEGIMGRGGVYYFDGTAIEPSAK